MKPENENPNNQLNVGTEQRNAGRDYFENAGIGSIDVALTTWTPEKLDETSKFNPNLFARRFGFSVTTLVRAQVIEFQRTYDLLDKDIWWLRRSGHIQVSRTGITIDTSPLTFIFGMFQVAMFTHCRCAATQYHRRTKGPVIASILDHHRWRTTHHQ